MKTFHASINTLMSLISKTKNIKIYLLHLTHSRKNKHYLWIVEDTKAGLRLYNFDSTDFSGAGLSMLRQIMNVVKERKIRPIFLGEIDWEDFWSAYIYYKTRHNEKIPHINNLEEFLSLFETRDAFTRKVVVPNFYRMTIMHDGKTFVFLMGDAVSVVFTASKDTAEKIYMFLAKINACSRMSKICLTNDVMDMILSVIHDENVCRCEGEKYD